VTNGRYHAQAARSRVLVHIALLTASYFLAGRLALSLAVQSGFAVAVWPAAAHVARGHFADTGVRATQRVVLT
jgi:uncharacterized membrane protein (GlpM family)